MTTKEKFEDMLVQNSMWPDQAKKVVELAKKEFEVDNYRITWDRPAEEYPDSFYAVSYLTLRRVAAKWIEENMPQAWFRPMFDDEFAKNNGITKVKGERE